jgi:N-carbamoyl-L-amino-acid hydrolase
MDLGIVTGVQAISWQELVITGKAAHAGTTPMGLRRDAGLAAAHLVVKLVEMAASGDYGDEMRATVGRLDVAPNRVNIVPRQVICTVDLRNPDDAAMARCERDVADYLRQLEQEMGVRIEARQTAKTARVRFDEGIQRLLAAHMDRAGARYQHILSGAGHDAQELAALCPTAMIFVPGRYEGISHNPREYSTQEACAQGAQVLLDTLLELSAC